jgi:Uma2 family endonuclease
MTPGSLPFLQSTGVQMVATRITVNDFEEINQLPRAELIDGEIIEMTPSSDGSSSLAASITAMLWNHVRPNKLGRVYSADGGFVLFPDRETVRVPDVAFVRAERMPQGEARRHFPRLAPDLVVEVLSPTDRASDVLAKVAMYQEAGVPLIWLVDPEAQTVTVLATHLAPVTMHPGDTLDGGNVLPDLQIAVADIFE